MPSTGDTKPGDDRRFSFGKLLAAGAATVGILTGLQQLTAPDAAPVRPPTPSATSVAVDTPTATPTPAQQPATTRTAVPRRPVAGVGDIENVCLALEDEALRGPSGLVGYDSPQALANAAERLHNLRQPNAAAERINAAATDFEQAARLAAGSFFPRAAEEERKGREGLVALGAQACAAPILP
jgi:hypothetical protein